MFMSYDDEINFWLGEVLTTNGDPNTPHDRSVAALHLGMEIAGDDLDADRKWAISQTLAQQALGGEPDDMARLDMAKAVGSIILSGSLSQDQAIDLTLRMVERLESTAETAAAVQSEIETTLHSIGQLGFAKIYATNKADVVPQMRKDVITKVVLRDMSPN